MEELAFEKSKADVQISRKILNDSDVSFDVDIDGTHGSEILAHCRAKFAFSS